jgi:transposase
MKKDVDPYFEYKPREYDIFIGLDVDKKSISLTAMSQDGFVRSQKMPYGAAHLLSFVQRHFDGKRIVFAYEAGPTGYGLHDQLKAEGVLCLVIAPSMIPRASGERVKTNRLDSRKLAELLRSDRVKAVHVPYGCYRDLRHLAALRQRYVQDLSAAKVRCKALLLLEGLRFPESKPHSQWTKATISGLRELPCRPAIRFKLDQIVSTLEYSASQVLLVTQEMRRFCRQETELLQNIQLLTTIPGIGWIVAMHLLARIGDWRQLKNARQIAGFLGLVPREKSTGESVHRGPITRLGDSAVRGKLIEGAWMAVLRDPELKEFYVKVYQRNPRAVAARKAIVAVARKLTVRIFAVLTQQRAYTIHHNKSIA